MQNFNQNPQMPILSQNLRSTYSDTCPPLLARVVKINHEKKYFEIVKKDKNGDQTDKIKAIDETKLDELNLYDVYKISNYRQNSVEYRQKFLYICDKNIVFHQLHDDYEIDFDLSMETFDDFEHKDKRFTKFWAIIVDIGDLHHSADGIYSCIVLLANKTEKTIQLELKNSYALSIQESDIGKVIFAYRAYFSVNKGLKRITLVDESIVKIFDRSNNNSKANDLFD